MDSTIQSPLKQQSISAVVVNYNGGQDVLNCLKALKQQPFKALKQQPFPLEKIIVVDNASTDGSPSEILTHFPETDLIKLERNYGPSKARNIGLQHAQSELVLLLDDDAYVHPDCIRILSETYDKYRSAVICPRILFYPDTHMIQCDGAELHFIGTLKLRHCLESVLEHPPDVIEVNACIGACLLVNRAATLSCGGFEEAYFFYFEDLEFSLRLRSMGFSIVCAPQALALHDRGTGTPGLSFRGGVEYPKNRVYYTIRHRIMTLLIHYRLKTLIILSPVFLIYELSAIAMMINRGWLGVWRDAMVSVFKNKQYISERRKLIQARRRCSDGEMLTGGPLPVAQGLMESRLENACRAILSLMLNLYWSIVKKRIG
jgi:GT2 family glycosyltransferase